jgi:ribosomal protein S12 methylthiotransferase accessory factor
MIPSTLRHPPYSQIVDGLTGIVPYIAEVEWGRSDPDVFYTVAGSAVETLPSSAELAHYGIGGRDRRISGCGVGLNYEQALWAAAGEVAERYCLYRVPHGELVVASWKELADQGQEAIAPNRWALFDSGQYKSSNIPFPFFGDDTPVAWVRAQSLTRRHDCYVPACMIYFCPVEGAQIVSHAISTGAACAPEMPGAILRGICEVVERDAFIIMWRNQLPCPRVEIDPASSIYSLFQEKFVRPGLDYTLIHTTLDVQIPSFLGILRNLRHDPPRIVVGGACHPDPNKAVWKTLFELMQGLQWLQNPKPKSFTIEPGFANIRTFEDRMSLYAYGNQAEALSFLLDNPDAIKLSTIASADLGDDGASASWCCNEMAKRNIEVLALDITSADIAEAGLSVVKVLAPECQPMEADHRLQFLGGSRWREVPVQLGFRRAVSSIETINPYPHPFP